LPAPDPFCVILQDGFELTVDVTKCLPRVDFPVFSSSSSFLFPLPFICIPVPSRVGGGNARRRRAITTAALQRLNQLIQSLNQLSLPDAVEAVPPRPPTTAQRRALELLYCRCRRVEKLLGSFQAEPAVSDIETWSGNPADELALRMWLQQEDEPHFVPALVSGWQRIEVNLLSLPSTGEGAQVDLLANLPADLRELYSSPTNLLVSPPPSEEVLEATGSAFGISVNEYPKLLQRLHEVGLVEFRVDPPLCTNGLFAVPKDETHQRLIIDARRANLFFVEPQKVNLPSPTLFADMLVTSKSQIFVGKSDIRNMYHRIRTPEWMHTYFGLPPADSSALGLAGEGVVYPVVVSLPMGFSHAVLLAHSINVATATSIVPSLFPLLSDKGPHHLGNGAVLYIDDMVALSTSVTDAMDFKCRVDGSLSTRGFQVHEGKSVCPGTEDPVDCLGVAISRDGWVSPAPKRLMKIQQATVAVISKKSASPKALARLIGAWVWILLLNRPLLSILSSELYEFIQPQDLDPRPLSQGILDDLHLLLGIIPFLFVDTSVPCASQAFASDASLAGAGVVSTAITEEQVLSLFAVRYTRGWYENPAKPKVLALAKEAEAFLTNPDVSWTTIISSKWNYEDWINRLEAHALLLTLKHIVSVESLWNSRICFFIDSSAVLGSVAKGRSSSKRLNHILRRIAAFICTMGIRPLWFWVPSALNPADGPSRFHN